MGAAESTAAEAGSPSRVRCRQVHPDGSLAVPGLTTSPAAAEAAPAEDGPASARGAAAAAAGPGLQDWCWVQRGLGAGQLPAVQRPAHRRAGQPGSSLAGPAPAPGPGLSAGTADVGAPHAGDHRWIAACNTGSHSGWPLAPHVFDSCIGQCSQGLGGQAQQQVGRLALSSRSLQCGAKVLCAGLQGVCPLAPRGAGGGRLEGLEGACGSGSEGAGAAEQWAASQALPTCSGAGTLRLCLVGRVPPCQHTMLLSALIAAACSALGWAHYPAAAAAPRPR